MELAWDEAKRRANYAKHGLDFRDAEKVFQGITLTAEDNRQDYGETRFISLGLLDDAGSRGCIIRSEKRKNPPHLHA